MIKVCRFIALSVALAFAGHAAAHQGEHNETGCHKHEKGEYHCHPSK